MGGSCPIPGNIQDQAGRWLWAPWSRCRRPHSLQVGWKRWPSQIPSNSNHSMIQIWLCYICRRKIHYSLTLQQPQISTLQAENACTYGGIHYLEVGLHTVRFTDNEYFVVDSSNTKQLFLFHFQTVSPLQKYLVSWYIHLESKK